MTYGEKILWLIMNWVLRTLRYTVRLSMIIHKYDSKPFFKKAKKWSCVCHGFCQFWLPWLKWLQMQRKTTWRVSLKFIVRFYSEKGRYLQRAMHVGIILVFYDCRAKNKIKRTFALGIAVLISAFWVACKSIVLTFNLPSRHLHEQ